MWFRRKKTDPPDEAMLARRKRRRRRRWWFYGGLTGAFWCFYVWQPWEFDFIPRSVPKSNPKVSPEPERLFARGAKVLLVTAHPDDSEFYIGGTLVQLGRAGAEVTHVLCTDGDKAYYPFEDHEKNRRTRRAEQAEASGRWSVRELVYLGHPDGRLRVTDKLVDDLVAVMERVQPEFVLAFDGDYPPRFSHQDHRRAGEATERAVMKYGKAKWLMRFSTIAANYVRDITDDWPAKSELLAIHKSQFFGERLERVRGMVAGRAEEDGEAIGVPLGEGFRCTRLEPQ